MPMKEMQTEEFLHYESRSSRNYLRPEWKKAGWIEVWLHRKRPFAIGWQHQLPRIDVRDNEAGEPKRVIFSGSYRCLEDDVVLKEQWRRDRDTGERETPPVICPICRMIEHIHTAVVRGEMHWLEPIFDFDVGDPKTRRFLRASGLFGYPKAKNLTDDQKAELEDAGVSERTAWQENMNASLKYVFCLVDDAAPQKGVQIMKEGQGLGDKVKMAITKEMKRNPRNPALGDPVKTPYAFRFEYNENALPEKKYDAFRVDYEITPALQQLISGEPPNIDSMAGDYTPETLRASLERVCLVELPWDEWFTDEVSKLLANEEPPAETQAMVRAPQAAAPAPRQLAGRQVASRSALEPERQRTPARVVAPARQSSPAQDVALFGCDGCGKPIKATDAKCPHCGMEYDVEQQPKPEPAPLRKRSEIGRPVPAAAPSRAVPAERQQRVAAPIPRQSRQAPAPVEVHDAQVVDPSEDVGFGDFDDEMPNI